MSDFPMTDVPMALLPLGMFIIAASLFIRGGLEKIANAIREREKGPK